MKNTPNKKNYYGAEKKYVPYLKVYPCRELTPACLQFKGYGYVKTRVNQPMCLECLKWKGILDKYKIKKLRK